MRYDGRLGDLKLETDRLKASPWKDTLAFSDVLQDFPVLIVPSGLNTTNGLRPFHSAGQAGLGPIKCWV